MRRPFQFNRRTVRSLALFALACVVGPPAIAQRGTIELGSLDGADGFVLIASADTDRLGTGVSHAGDINGDGRADLVVGGAGDSFLSTPGRAFVLFGRDSYPAVVDLSLLDGSDGFRIDRGSDLGRSVSAAGDVNGDGLDDLVVGAGLAPEGSAFVIFGQLEFASAIDVDLLDGTDGFRIIRDPLRSGTGEFVAGAGDVNGDDLDDILVGDSQFGSQAYVVFGSAAPSAEIELADLDGETGFAVVAAEPGDHLGEGMTAAGDFNDDGFDDFVVGAAGGDPSDRSSAGEAYLIYGRASFDATLDVGLLDETSGLVIAGATVGGGAGTGLGGGADLNDDGHLDLLVGAPGAHSGGEAGSGRAHIVFGGPGLGPVIDLAESSVGEAVHLSGFFGSGQAGERVASAGDVNGDGVSDLVVGAPGVTSLFSVIGEAYLVYGRPSFPLSVPLDSLVATNGLRFVAEAGGDLAEGAVAGVGDLDGDGFAEIAIGAPYFDGINGAVYVVYGGPSLELSASLEGTCPGGVTLSADGLTPGGAVVVALSERLGPGAVPGGRCAGVELSLASVREVRDAFADADGELTVALNAPVGLCGSHVQVVDVATCLATDAVQLP